MKFFIAALVVSSIAAQDVSEQSELMKSIAADLVATRRGIDAKSPDAAARAMALSASFGKVQDFWKTRGAADAQESAAAAKAAAEQIAEFAQANKFSQTGPAFARLAGTCKGCHDAHREKMPDGSWKVK